MAKSNSTRAHAPDFYSRKPTTAERNRAIRQLQKHGGAHAPRPENLLVGHSPVDTLERCSRVVGWMATTMGDAAPGDDHDAARTDVLCTVFDALRHALRVLQDIGHPPSEAEGGAS
jgi:hypothetical protein